MKNDKKDKVPLAGARMLRDVLKQMAEEPREQWEGPSGEARLSELEDRLRSKHFPLKPSSDATIGEGATFAPRNLPERPARTARSNDPDLPAAKLRSLLKTSDLILRSIFHNERQRTLDLVTQHVHDLLGAEACAIFLPAANYREELVLESSFSDKDGQNFNRGFRLRVQSISGGGVTGHVAATGAILNLSYQQLITNKYRAGNVCVHLRNETGFSYLGIPLMDRHGMLLGVVTVDNKKDLHGQPNRETSFDEVDEALARILANTIGLVLENLHKIDAFGGVVLDIQNAYNRRRVLHSILRRAIDLLHADRGDFALWDPAKKRLVIEAVEGEITPRTGSFGEDAPVPGFMHSLWVSQKSDNISGNVKAHKPHYYEADRRVKSEIAVRLQIEGRSRGILNVESFRADAFDEQDLAVLRMLARYAVICVEVTWQESELWAMMERTLEANGTIQNILRRILESVHDLHEFDAGLIYIADYQEQRLRCEASIGCDHLECPASEFSYHFNDPSVASSVLRTGQGFFTSDVHGDPLINPRGLRYFDIHGPLVGVPLVFRDKVVGVLILWSRKGPMPTREHIDRLKPIAKLAAWRIAVWKMEQSQAPYESLVESLPQSVLRKDVEGRFTYVSERFSKLLGRPKQDILSKTDFDFYPKNLAKKYRRDDLHVMRTLRPLDLEEQHLVPGKKKMRLVRVNKLPVVDSEGKCIGIQATFWDITTRVEQRKKLEALEHQYHSLLESCPDTILLLHGEKIAFANQAAMHLLRARKDHIEGQSLARFLAPDPGRSTAERILRMVQATTTTSRLEERFVYREKGSKRSINVEVAASYIAGTHKSELLLFVHDITRRKIDDERIGILTDLLQRLGDRDVFVCYSHQDEVAKAGLDHLHELVPNRMDVWSDSRITASKQWISDIDKTLSVARVAVVLVSSNLLKSELVRTKSLPRLLKAKATQGLRILPVIVDPVPPHHPLAKFPPVNPECSIWDMSPWDRRDVWRELGNSIRGTIG